MIRRPPRSTRNDTLFPYTTLFRSILESGGAGRSREQYLGHHAISDARFLKDSQREIAYRKARAAGDLAWVASESKIQVAKDGNILSLLSSETMVLRHGPDGWRIIHIHWSSRPHTNSGETLSDEHPGGQERVSTCTSRRKPY